MPTILPANLIARIPVHDAQLLDIRLTPQSNGDFDIGFEMCLHEDETIENLAAFGVHGRTLRLSFRNVWQFAASLYGVITNRELISAWEIKSESELLRKLDVAGFEKTQNLLHHRIMFSGGSAVDIVAETVLVE